VVPGKLLLRRTVANLREDIFGGSRTMKTFDTAVALAICIIVAQLLFG